MTSIKDPKNQTIQFGYNKNGASTKVIFPKGDTITSTYNALNRLSGVYYNGIQKFGYTYDASATITDFRNSNYKDKVTIGNGSYMVSNTFSARIYLNAYQSGIAAPKIGNLANYAAGVSFLGFINTGFTYGGATSAVVLNRISNILWLGNTSGRGTKLFASGVGPVKFLYNAVVL